MCGEGTFCMKNSISAAELSAAKQGDEQALAAVIVRMLPAIHRRAAAAVMPGLDFDDAVQEGLMGLLGAVQSYRAEGNASFVTYAGVCIQNAIRTARKAAGRKKHSPLNQSLPLPEMASSPGPEEKTIAREQVRLVMRKARTVLSPLEKQVLSLLIEGFTPAEIAGKLGRAPKVVENALTRLRRKLK